MCSCAFKKQQDYQEQILHDTPSMMPTYTHHAWELRLGCLGVCTNHCANQTTNLQILQYKLIVNMGSDLTTNL